MSCLQQLINSSQLADTHCHLHSEIFDDTLIAELLLKCEGKGIKELWLMSIDQESFTRNVEIIKKFRNRNIKFRLALGFDMELLVPGSDLFKQNFFSFSITELIDKLSSDYEEAAKLVASEGLEIDLIGEVGLDHYWLLQNDNPQEIIEKSKRLQEAMFVWQLEYAAKNNLPISIHSRGAEAEVFEFIQNYQEIYPGIEIIFHSFTNPELIKDILNASFFIGVNGIVTYKSAAHLFSIIKQQLQNPKNIEDIYHKNFLLETDAPYLIPANAERKSLLRKSNKPINDPSTISDICQFLTAQ